MSHSPEDPTSHIGDDALVELADEFVRRYRAGEQPALEEYVHRYPELAERIRLLLPAVLMMEQQARGATAHVVSRIDQSGQTTGRVPPGDRPLATK